MRLPIRCLGNVPIGKHKSNNPCRASRFRDWHNGSPKFEPPHNVSMTNDDFENVVYIHIEM